MDQDALDEEIDRVIQDLGHAAAEHLADEQPECGILKIRSADGSWDADEVLSFLQSHQKSLRSVSPWVGTFDVGRELDTAELPELEARRRRVEVNRIVATILEIQWWRNAEAHNRRITFADAVRALDSAERVLRAMGLDDDANNVHARSERLVLAYADHIRHEGWGAPVRATRAHDDRTITAAVTWANQVGGDDWLRDLWYGVIDRGTLQFDRATPETVLEVLRDLGQRGTPVTVGFAFSLGAPAAVMGKGRRWQKADDMWREVAALSVEVPDMQERIRRAPAPFWGLGLPNSAPPKGEVHRATDRRVEAELTPTHSILQLTGQGNVGALSLAGLPMVNALLADGFRVWPFHTPPGDLRIVEVFPRALLQHLRPHRGENYDPREAFLDSTHARDLRIGRDSRRVLSESLRAFDAVFCTWALREHGDPLPDVTSNPAARLEGEIWLPS